MSYYNSYTNYLGAQRCCNNNSAGAQGAQGAQGLGGPIGPKGMTGPQGAQGAQGATHSVRALLTQGQVVFAATTRIGVAFKVHSAVAVRAQVARVCFEHALVFALDGIAVKLEVNDVFHTHRALLDAFHGT